VGEEYKGRITEEDLAKRWNKTKEKSLLRPLLKTLFFFLPRSSTQEIWFEGLATRCGVNMVPFLDPDCETRKQKHNAVLYQLMLRLQNTIHGPRYGCRRC